MPEPAEDEAWVRRLKSEDSTQRDAAIDELRVLLLRALNRTLTQRYGTKVPVDDIVQEALVKILDSIDQFAGRSRFSTWAITVATRVGLTELRRKRYRDVSLDTEEGSTILAAISDGADSAEDDSERQRILSTLGTVIQDDLTDKQRLAIQASLDGLPVDEIATRIGSKRNAVYKLIHDARQKLRDGLESRGIHADDIHQAIA